MAIKLKSSRKIRMIIIIFVLAVLAFLNVCYFPVINQKAEAAYASEEIATETLDYEFLNALYRGTQVLYYHQIVKGMDSGLTPIDIFVNREYLDDEEQSWIQESFDAEFENRERKFRDYRYRIHYYATNGTFETENTDKNLKGILSEEQNKASIEELKQQFRNLWVMEFDEYGSLHIEVLDSEDVAADILINGLQEVEENSSIAEMLESYCDITNARAAAKEVKKFTVIYGILAENQEGLLVSENEFSYSAYMWHLKQKTSPLFFAMTILIVGLAVLMTNPKIWKDITSVKRKGKWYLFEPAVVGVCLYGTIYTGYREGIYEIQRIGLKSVLELTYHFDIGMAVVLFGIWIRTCFIFAIIFLLAFAFTPILTLGFKEYMRQYSIVYQIFPNLKRLWKKLWGKFETEIAQIDFEKNSTKTIIKIVVINFIVLAVLMCMWVLGILGLVIYSVLLFFWLSDKYDKMSKDYQVLMKATSRMAEGDLEAVITEEIGIFEPLKEELAKIRIGFKKAVKEEMKSQRMKTELITNVSHDLKTPLTAITTYVELLKKEDITEEERNAYIETLEKKSLRLKVLIEDLFEVSKANSENITLHLIKVDLVKLMKQVAIEHSQKYEAAGIELRFMVPEQKVELLLDSQKTYRIFENLFMNIQKYAMENSRVYIEVSDDENQVIVVMKNMSAAELNIAPEELTERFVRGDASRNTEGAGLGLAIAKSFTEAQNGIFEVTVDGDLFKTTIIFSKNKLGNIVS